LEYLGIDRIILKWNIKMWNGVMHWSDLAQDRGRWRGLVSVVTNLHVP